MSAPPVPSFFAGTASLVRLTLLRTLRGRKLRVAAIATFTVLLFPAIIALSSDDADATAVVRGGIDWGFYRLLVFVLPVLFVSGAIGEEVEGRTLHFLSMRPVSRAAIALAKYIVGAGASLAVLWAGIILLHVIGYATSPTSMIEEIGATARAGGAASLLVLTYSGVCLFWGTVAPSAGSMISLLWLGFFEWFMGLAPGVFRFVSMAHFARELGGVGRAGMDEWIPEVDLWICAAIVCGFGFLVTLLGVLVMRSSELRFGKA